MKVRDITSLIEEFAPLKLQESYDNAGLIVGREDDEIHRVLLVVDVTEEVIEEAIENQCDMIVAHHPIIFHPLKRFNSSTYVERCVEQAIRHGIVIYAAHTNLDSAQDGMSWRVAQMLGLERVSVLDETNMEGAGFGVVGELPEAVSESDFLTNVKSTFSVEALRHSELLGRNVKRVAICTGAGASLMGEAKASKCDIYLTADLKYNDFYTPDSHFVVVDMGHFESEFCAIAILFDILSKIFINFALHKSAQSKNPVHYFV
jgi:dinuclear metal center YbgI/SA1388 family protein